MARRSGFSKKIETVHWTGAAGQFITQGAGTVAGLLFSAQHLPETLLRIRGEYLCILDGPQAALVGAQISMGIIQVPEGSGTTVTWSPFTDSDAPWIWWDSVSLIYEEMVVDVIQASGGSGARRVVDSKAMRKLRNTELQLVLENTTIPGVTGADIHFNLNCRVLTGS